MKLTVLALLAACHASTPDDYPIGGGGVGVGGGTGGGGGGSGAIDAGIDSAPDPDGGVPISGRVCLITDMRNLTACSLTGARGLTVSLGTRSTTITTDDGSFTFTAQLGDSFVWRVTSTIADRIIPSVVPFGPDHSLPVISMTLYTELQVANTVKVADQQGSIVVRVVQGTSPVSGVVVASPTASPPILYDSKRSAQVWDQLQTGTAGVAWLPIVPLANTPPTTVTVTLTPSGAAPITTRVPVENRAITFVTKDIK